MTIAALNRKVSDALSNREEAYEYAVDDMDLSAVMVRMMQSRLFNEGRDIDGNELTPFYAPVTQNIKEEKGQPYDRVTLRDTGAFYESFKAEYDGSGNMVFYATDEKLDEDDGELFNTQERLEEKYGDRIMGLTEDDKVTIRGMTVKNIREWFYKKTGL